jgi:hypothetical protein
MYGSPEGFPQEDGREARAIDEQVGADHPARGQPQARHSGVVLEDLNHGVLLYDNAKVKSHALQVGHELLVLDMIREVAVHHRLAVALAHPNGIVRHEPGGNADVVERPLVTIVTGAFGQDMVLGVELPSEGVIEVGPLSPEETNAQFPQRLRPLEEVADVELQVLVQVFGDTGNRALADADDADVRGTQYGHGQMWQAMLQSDRGEETRAASAQYEHAVDHIVDAIGTVHVWAPSATSTRGMVDEKRRVFAGQHSGLAERPRPGMEVAHLPKHAGHDGRT